MKIEFNTAQKAKVITMDGVRFIPFKGRRVKSQMEQLASTLWENHMEYAIPAESGYGFFVYETPMREVYFLRFRDARLMSGIICDVERPDRSVAYTVFIKGREEGEAK